MAIQTRTQLQAKSATVQNETAPSANTAARVGGLFDDFADSVSINSERGFITLYLDSDTLFGTENGNTIPINLVMDKGDYAGNMFVNASGTITYTGLDTANIRVAAILSFAGANNKEYTFYIAKNNQIIPQSSCRNTTQGTHSHPAFTEAFLNVNPNDTFSVYVYSNNTANITINTLTFSAFTI